MARKQRRAQRTAAPASPSLARSAALSTLAPLGALAAGFGFAGAALAQSSGAEEPKQANPLPVITVRGTAETESKESYRTKRTSIGKGNQALRDIPQSVTVVTERLMDDRNLDDLKEVLRSTAGVTFQAGETGEEDVRLRGFSLQQAGDIYIDGMRDPALYDRDTFNHDRVEVLKGSASMLFGRGSTGGVVNQVSKQPFLMNQHEVETTIGSGDERRITGDFNFKTGDDAALRINAMLHQADNWGAKVDKMGFAPTLRWGIGTADEFSVGLFHLEYDNRPIYNHPWFIDANGTLQPTLPAKNFYGFDSDYNKGQATYGTLSHIHRFGAGHGELKTTLRHGRYERELWVTVTRFQTAPTSLDDINDDTVLTRGSKGRVARTDVTTLQSDYTNTFDWLGRKHNLITGIDFTREDAKRNNNYADPAGTPRPTTTVGNPNSGGSIEDLRAPIVYNTFETHNIGLYVQDTLELTPALKLVGGVRYDHFKGSYDTADGNDFSRSDSMWSPRLGLLYQPNDWSSYHVSFGTSYNTSGDAYQFAVRGPEERVANTPPEKSRNFEVGGKFDLFDNRLSLGTALFYAEKYNERNTDPDSAATQELLSGKRHAAGLDLDIAGRITPQWEAFFSYTWIPEAEIDESNVQATSPAPGGGTRPNNAQREGDRPGLTPKHSASLWTTYRVIPALRIGGGLNHRGKQNPEGNRTVTAKAFTTLDLMAEYTFNENLSLKFNVNNATDELYADSLYRGFYAPGAPRTYQLSLKAVF